MLPWDRLAQFVTVASFEWLDWLPGFGGTLIRNFIYPTSVNDRFFLAAGPSCTSACRWCAAADVGPRAARAQGEHAAAAPDRAGLRRRCWCCRWCTGGQPGRAAHLAHAAHGLQLDWFY
jgi:hypothetical protein